MAKRGSRDPSILVKRGSLDSAIATKRGSLERDPDIVAFDELLQDKELATDGTDWEDKAGACVGYHAHSAPLNWFTFEYVKETHGWKGIFRKKELGMDVFYVPKGVTSEVAKLICFMKYYELRKDSNKIFT